MRCECLVFTIKVKYNEITLSVGILGSRSVRAS